MNDRTRDWDLYVLIKYQAEPEVWCLWTSGCYEWVRSQYKIAEEKYTLEIRMCPEIQFGEGGYEEKTWDINMLMQDKQFKVNLDKINKHRGIIWKMI